MDTLTLTSLNKSEFAKFFHIKELKRKKLDNGNIMLHVKTGGFQEFVDILIALAPDEESIVEAELLIKRSWLEDKSQIMFGLDIVKSFLIQFSKDKEYISPLVTYLWKKGKTPLTEQDFIKAVNVIFNKFTKHNFSSSLDKFQIRNGSDHLKNQLLSIKVTSTSAS